jgi:hypothetical protein
MSVQVVESGGGVPPGVVLLDESGGGVPQSAGPLRLAKEGDYVISKGIRRVTH